MASSSGRSISNNNQHITSSQTKSKLKVGGGIILAFGVMGARDRASVT
jgi:hypothetical protein